MTVAVMNEAKGRERRVAMVPEVAARVKALGVGVLVETGAGEAAGFTDAMYAEAGAEVVKDMRKTRVDVLLCLAVPEKVPAFVAKDGVVVGLGAGVAKGFGGTVLALEKLPRTSRAQAMDVLSSQANLGGYAAVVRAAGLLPKLMPMMMTAAGSAKPANVLVLGVGVAGLQAIATAKRLGAVVHAFDVRPEVGEQILSLGAKPVILETRDKKQETRLGAAQGQGGYAGAMDEAGLKRLQELLAPVIAASDMVVTTAQVPGRPAPVLVSGTAVAGMKPGSVIVDMAAGGFNKANGIGGGNCPLTVADEVTVTGNGVSIVGETNFPALMAKDASRFWAQNMLNLLKILVKDGQIVLNDELVAAMKGAAR